MLPCFPQSGPVGGHRNAPFFLAASSLSLSCHGTRVSCLPARCCEVFGTVLRKPPKKTPGGEPGVVGGRGRERSRGVHPAIPGLLGHRFTARPVLADALPIPCRSTSAEGGESPCGPRVPLPACCRNRSLWHSVAPFAGAQPASLCLLPLRCCPNPCGLRVPWASLRGTSVDRRFHLPCSLRLPFPMSRSFLSRLRVYSGC
jgi:hypothetical protein